MGEIIDINHLAVWKYIDEFEIKNRKDCFNKTIKVFHHILQYQKENNEEIKTYDALKQE